MYQVTAGLEHNRHFHSSEIMGENVTHKQKRGYEHVGFSLASPIAVGSLHSEASLSRLHNSDGKEHLIALMAKA